jgi:hypothetical protein
LVAKLRVLFSRLVFSSQRNLYATIAYYRKVKAWQTRLHGIVRNLFSLKLVLQIRFLGTNLCCWEVMEVHSHDQIDESPCSWLDRLISFVFTKPIFYGWSIFNVMKCPLNFQSHWLQPLTKLFFYHVGAFQNRVMCKVTLCFTPISSAFGPYPLFQWYPQSKEILLNLGMKWWNSAFNAQGSNVIIVVVQVGAVKIYVAAV